VDLKILLTVAARGGSKGVKNKNIRPLGGKPLISYTLELAKRWGRASDIVVTTDSPQIADVVRELGIEVPFMRPAEMAEDTSPKVPALRHALLTTEKLKGVKYDLVLDLDPTAPIRALRDLDNALALFLERRPQTLLSAVVASKNPYFNMLEIAGDGFAKLSKPLPKGVSRRQDAPPVFSANASIYIYNRDYLANEAHNSAISDKTVLYEMGDESAIDVDREIDFQFIEFLLEKGHWRPDGAK
jgi:CMP-N,N'-diacetyllegionaminic acid synthase